MARKCRPRVAAISSIKRGVCPGERRRAPIKKTTSLFARPPWGGLSVLEGGCDVGGGSGGRGRGGIEAIDVFT